LPGMPQAAAPTGPPRPPTCSSRRSSGSGMASATSPTTAYGCCCTAASGGRRTAPQDCEAAPHAWPRRARTRNAPSADRISCRGRAGKCRAATSVRILDGRQPTEREVEAAAMGGPATKQGGVSIRIASSRSNRRTWPAHCLRCQFGLACLVSAGRREDAATSGSQR